MLALLSVIGLNSWADEINATLDHTAGTRYGSAATSANTVDGTAEYINNDANSGWVGYAFAQFSFEIPEGESITEATFTWWGTSSKGYGNVVYYLNEGVTLDYDAILSTQANYRFADSRTKIVDAGSISGGQTKVVDVTDAVKAIAAKQNYIIFQITDNNGSGTMAGKGATENVPTLVIKTASASTQTTYVVKYTDGTNELKESKTYDGTIGNTVSASDEDVASFVVEGTKYVYSSGNSTITLDGDAASNVITLVFSEAAKYSYALKSSLGTTIAEGETFADETVKIPYPKYLLDGTTLRGAKQELTTSKDYFNYALTVDQNGKEATISYDNETIGDVVYFAEAEDIEGMTKVTGSNANIRCSMAAGGYNAGDEITLTTLPAGKYKITALAWGNAGQTLKVVCGETELAVATAGYLIGGTTDEFTVNTPTAVTVPTCGADGKVFDYIYIQKTGDVEKAPVYTVAGNLAAIFGTAWDPTAEANIMTLDPETGLYTLTKENVELEDGTILYKVVKNQSWDTSWGFDEDNANYEVTEAGTYNITFTFNPDGNLEGSDYQLGCALDKVVVEPEKQTFTASFTTNTGWEKVYAYAWSGDGDAATKFLGDWPGTEISATEGVYALSFEATAAPEKIIFNNGLEDDAKQQTADLAFEDGKAYSYIVVAAPTFSIEAGEVEAETELTLACATEGAEIYYTLDGSAPTAESSKYEAAFILTEDVTIKAVAILNGVSSAVATAAYTIKQSEVPAVYTVAGAFGENVEGNTNDAIFGKAWNATLNEMTLNEETGLYTWTKENVTLEAGTILYKVVKNKDWEVQSWGFGDANADYVVNEAGTYNITITFNPNGVLEGSDYNLGCALEKIGGDEPQPELNTYTATFTTNAEWEKVYAYAFTKTGDGDEATTTEFLGAWPGTELTKNAETGLYDVSIKAAAAPAFIVFNNGITEGEGKAQTEDLAFENEKAYEYTVQTEPVLTTYTATFENTGEWDAVYAYVWTTTGEGEGAVTTEPLGTFPGRSLDKNGETGLYELSFQAEEAPANIIFSNNAGTQTDDLVFEDGKAYKYEAPVGPVLTTYTATFTTNAEWAEVYAYAFTTIGEGEEAITTEPLNAWPGKKLEKNAETGAYELSFDDYEAPAFIIFNNGQGGEGNQTEDLAFENGKAYEYTVLGDMATGTIDFQDLCMAIGKGGPWAVNDGGDAGFTIGDAAMHYLGNYEVNGQKFEYNHRFAYEYVADRGKFTMRNRNNKKDSNCGMFSWDYAHNFSILGLKNGDKVTITTLAGTTTFVSNNVTDVVEAGDPVVSNQTYTITADEGETTRLDINMAAATLISKIVIEPFGVETVPTIALNKSSLVLIPGATAKLTATVDPASATTKWVSDNEAVATVAEDGTVTAVAAGTTIIRNAWASEVSDATVSAECTITVSDINLADYEIVEDYDFLAMGDVTLELASEAAGAIWNEANSKNNNVFFCTNEGLENIAVQAAVSGNKGWSIVDGKGLFLATGAGRCAAVGGIKAGQIVEFIYTGEGFYTKSDDDGISKTALNEATGRAIYMADEDGMIGFELDKGNAVQQINIYQLPVSVYTVAGTFNEWNATDDVMTLNEETGLYEWQIEGINVTNEEKPEFKVVNTFKGTQTWYPAGDGSTNWVITPVVVGGQDGNYDITITFNPETSEIAVTGTYKGEATGIFNFAVKYGKDVKVFNAAGQRVKAPVKGLNIINGKKVVIK